MTRNAPPPHRRTRDHVRALEAAGCTVLEIVVSGGKHIQYKVRHPAAPNEKIFTGPFSGSDWRGLRNFGSTVKRWVRDQAVQ